MADITEGEPAVDKYYFCDGLQSDGFFQEQSQETWSKMMKLWLVDTQGGHLSVLQTFTVVTADTYKIGPREVRGEQLKNILFNCVGRLRCQWTVLRCKNNIPGASTAINVQSCGYDTDVCH